MIHLNNKNVSDSKFEMHLLCMAFHKFGVMILKIFLFGQLLAEIIQWPKYKIFKINTPPAPYGLNLKRAKAYVFLIFQYFLM